MLYTTGNRCNISSRYHLPLRGNRILTYLRHNLQASGPVLVVAIAVYLHFGIDSWALGLTLVFAVFLSLLYTKMYVNDIMAVSKYINHMADGIQTKTPDVTALSNMDIMIDSIHNLCIKWRDQQLTTQCLAIETEMLFNIVPESLVAIDYTFKIVKANTMSTITFGTNLINRKITNIIKDKGFGLCIKRAVNNNEDSCVEVDLTEERGAIYTITIRNFPRSQDGSKIFALVLIHDITEQKNKDKINSDFIANASHEIRTPLTTIFGFIETLKNDNINKKNKDEFLSIMSSQCVRITNLLADMTQLYTLDVSSKPKIMEMVNLEAILDNVIREFTIELRNKNMRITLICSSYEDEFVITGDGTGIRSIVTNLISNAIKYGYTSSELKIIMTKTIVEQKQFIRIKFIDQSSGIPAKYIPRLTERFYRTDVSHSSNIPGTGLGLAIVKSALEQHDGYLEILSTISQGSEFIALLPVVGAP